MNRQLIIDVLNEMLRNDVVESGGGEDAYLLVKDNEVNRNKLREVGITDEQISNFSDDDCFCILALAFNEKLADDYTHEFIIWNQLVDDDLRYRVLNGEAAPTDAERLLRELDNQIATTKEKNKLDDGRKIGFVQGVAYAAGLCRRFGSDSEQILKESGISEDEIKKYCDDYDLDNLGMIQEDE